MKNKYYTPQITEFRIRFEYELEDPITKMWVKFIFEEDKLWFVKSNNCRVKYLTKEDIESCGFVNIGSNWFKKEKCLTTSGRNFMTCMLRKWSNLEVDIYGEYDDKEQQLIFRGNIKNLSELKQILKMIGVE
jgi:hypothetical protein